MQACANRDQQRCTRHRLTSCEFRTWGSEIARSCEGNDIPACDALPMGQAGAQHCQSPITAEGRAVIMISHTRNTPGRRRKNSDTLAAPMAFWECHSRHFALCPKGPGKRWGHTKRKAACVATSGPSLGRKRPRRAAIPGALTHSLAKMIAISGSIGRR
jgi:hypothetical protein